MVAKLTVAVRAPGPDSAVVPNRMGETGACRYSNITPEGRYFLGTETIHARSVAELTVIVFAPRSDGAIALERRAEIVASGEYGSDGQIPEGEVVCRRDEVP